MLPLNKKAIAHAFGRVSLYYDKFAKLQRLIGDNMINLISCNSGNLLDAGCGTGWYSLLLKNLGYKVTALDISNKMLKQAHKNNAADRYILGDIDNLPIANKSMDVVWSNLALQWTNNLQLALNNFIRVLRKGGFILFSTLAEGTLKELHHALDQMGLRLHNKFVTHNEIFSICQQLQVKLQYQNIRLYFPNALTAIRSLKLTGTTYLHHKNAKNRILLTREYLAKLENFWKKNNNNYSLTYKVLYGIINK